MSYLEIKNFNKTFSDGFQVLKDINVTVEKGEVLSIIGSSGSGKTTLLRCINFLETTDSGTMVLDGELLIDGNIKNEKESALREKRLNFGLVFQSFNLFPQYTVFKNLTLAPTLLLKDKINGLKKTIKSRKERQKLFLEEREKIREDCRTLLKKIGLEEKSNSYPCDLSGGQCQRMSIARALLSHADVLLCDEITSALDVTTQAQVIKLLMEIRDAENVSIILVSHDLALVSMICDRIMVMKDGKKWLLER